MNNSLTIADVEITTDPEGRINLNALHRASGKGGTKRPSIWLATQQAKELVAELEGQSQYSGFGVHTVHGGASPGTFAHELLAISYAGWISPAFQLQVNRAFLDYRIGKLVPAFPAEALTQIERSFGIMRMLAHKVTEMEKALPLIASEMADRIVTARLAESAFIMRQGKTAKQIWDAAGLPKRIKGSSTWFGNKLAKGGAMLPGRADRGDMAIRLFDPDRAANLLDLGLLNTARIYASERSGQGKFRLIVPGKDK